MLLVFLSNLTFVFLSFFLPTQLGYHFESLLTFVYGFRIDYLIPTLYLTDLLIILYILLNLKLIKFDRKQLIIVFGYILLVVINISYSQSPSISAYKWLKVTEFVIFGLVVSKNKTLNLLYHFFIPLSLSMITVCLLGIYHTLAGKTLGGIFYLLGERSFSLNTFGISTFTLSGIEFLRPYSTFSHPNSLAGFVVVFLLLTLYFRELLKPWYFRILLFLSTVILLLSVSLNAYVTLLFLLFLYLFKFGGSKLLILLVLVSITLITLFVPSVGIREIDYRVELANASVEMVSSNAVYGIGLNNFIPVLAQQSTIFKSAWDLQPVHNIYLLILSETGALGLILSGLFLSIINTSPFLIAILVSGLFDHYWLTLQQNMIMLTLVIAFSFGKLNSWKKS